MTEKNIKILIIDDEPVIRTLLLTFLTEEGYDATAVSNGLDAINQIKQTAFNIIISDINMPKMNGLEAMRIAKEISPNLTYIFMDNCPGKASKAREKGADIFAIIPKPFSLEAMIRIIQEGVTAQRKHA